MSMYSALGGHSFARRITVMVLLASGIAAATLTASFLMFDAVNSRALLRNRLTTLADVAGQNSAAALTFNDPAAASEVLEALRAEPPIVSACLYDQSARLFASYRRESRGPRCPVSSQQAPPSGNQQANIARRVVHHGEPLGTLLLSSDLQDLETRRRRMLAIAFGLFALALAVGGVSGWALQRRLSRPILDLARAMEKVTMQNDFATRVEVAGSDEIAQLGKGFNGMLAELERRNVEKLRRQALFDEITGLPNRRLLGDRLSQTLATAKRGRHLAALLYIDLDGFKLVNDSFGHTVGDKLLAEVAGRFSARVRRSDTLARIGGDEFAVVLASLMEEKEAERVANDMLQLIAAPFLVGDHTISVGASIGISLYPTDATDCLELFQQADSAMYSAKHSGKNTVCRYTSALGSKVRERLNLEAQLRGSYARGEMAVHYQPEFDVLTGRLVRFEALARWTHPLLGSISPGKFIPVAEESGVIVGLGAWIMRQACAEASSWQELVSHPIEVAVNVSSVQLARESFVDEVAQILDETGLPPELLQIELTESAMLCEASDSAEAMRRLRALGVSLAIDDFGTGYSSLSYLPRLPFDALKIDRTFVRDLGERRDAHAMISSLITLAHNFGLRVIAEGIEKPEQLEVIKELGGNEVQGYFLGRPVADPRSHLAAFIPVDREASNCELRVESCESQALVPLASCE